jgi:transposase-like protein
MASKVKKEKKDKKIYSCWACGSEHTVRHGFNVTKSGKYPRRKCQNCGTTFYEEDAEVRRGEK